MARRLMIVAIACIGCTAAANRRAVPGELGADGSLRFASPDEFFAAVDAVGRLTSDELDVWEQVVGFRSMRRGFAELERELAEATGPARAALMTRHADLLDPESSEPTRRVGPHGYASLIDERGVLYVDGVIHKITADQVLISRDGDPERLEARAAAGEVHAFRHTQTSSLTGACGNFFSGTRTVSDRRERYGLRTAGYFAEDAAGNRQYQYYAEIALRGEKKNLFGSWVGYNTTYQIYSLALDMDVLRTVSFNGSETQYDYDRRIVSLPSWDSPSEAANVTLTISVGDLLHNPVPMEPDLPSFHKAHVETTSRGTFPARGVIECGFCGDGTCSSVAGESAGTCVSDCGFCGDGICFNENQTFCPLDCGYCGDGRCDQSESDCWTDCQPQCVTTPC